MILSGVEIRARLARQSGDPADPLVVVPLPRAGGPSHEQVTASSIDLRLGSWFLSPRRAATSLLDLASRMDPASRKSRLADPHEAMRRGFIPFGSQFVLHPRSFVLAGTLEWIRLPGSLGATVVGLSSLGRRGLTIATATGVHPHFTGCLTLELANVGEIPVSIAPGMLICQLILHELTGAAPLPERSMHAGYRRPVMTDLKFDEVAQRLAKRREETA